MAYHRAPSPQTNPISASTYSQPALHRLHGRMQHVAFLTVFFIVIVIYPCVSYFRTLMWLVTTSKADIGTASLSKWELWLCKVKCNIYDKTTHSVTMRHTIPLPLNL